MKSLTARTVQGLTRPRLVSSQEGAPWQAKQTSMSAPLQLGRGGMSRQVWCSLGSGFGLYIACAVEAQALESRSQAPLSCIRSLAARSYWGHGFILSCQAGQDLFFPRVESFRRRDAKSLTLESWSDPLLLGVYLGWSQDRVNTRTP